MKIINLALLLITLAISTFLLWAYISLLNFFPWEDNKLQTILEPMLIYFIIPVLLVLGLTLILLQAFVNKFKGIKTTSLSMVMSGLIFSIPPIIGFGPETDFTGKWVGVFSSSIVILLLIFNTLKLRSNNK